MIVFEQLTFQNFLSAGNTEVCIPLNETKTTLIHGTNGSGKSTILDALCYALFNKPFRRINLPQLINTQNKKGLVASVYFSIGNSEFIVRRGMKPRLFEIYKNGELLDSKAADRDNQTFLEQNILKLSFKSFTQIVILGSSNFIPFMQLTSAARRECVEDFLDIKVFSTMGIIAKERLRGLKDNLHTINGDIGNIEFKIDVQEQHIKELEEKSQADTEAIQAEIEQCKVDIHTNEQRVTELQSNIKAQAGIIADLMKKNPAKRVGELTKIITTLQTKVQRNEKNISFYQDNDTCHTCKQDIDPAIKEKYVEASQREVEKYSKGIAEAQDTICTFEDSARIISQNQAYVAELQKMVYQYESKVDAIQRLLESHQKRQEDLQESTNDIYKDKGKLELLQCEHACIHDKKYDLIEQINEHEIVVNLLKDSGIKTQIVKKYLPAMNKFIRKYLTELDFPIHFILDEEFDEHVSSPLHQDFSYPSFSEGQKSRIDLSLMFTWRDIGKLKNSVTTNLLILDEVFSSSLDEDGKDKLINLIRYRLDDNQRVLVVDHTMSGNFKDKFDRTIEVTRQGGFSRYN